MLLNHRHGLLFLVALGITGLIGSAVRAQDDGAIVARMRKDINFLASDECEGRGVGTLGLDLAAEYIAVRFKQAGLKPGGVNGTYFQPFPFCTNAKLDGESTMMILGPKGKIQRLVQGTDFQVMGTSAPCSLGGPVVFVGYGVTARGIEYDDYAGIDVAGKIVIALRRLPRWSDKDRPFDGANKDDLAGLEIKQYRGQFAKAKAVILVNDASEANDNLIPFATTAKGISTASVPYVQMKRHILDEMLQTTTGKKLADVEKAIDDDLKPQSAEIKNYSITMNVKVNRQEVMVKNVIGVVDGLGTLADETVVVGAHYDHLGYGGPGSLAGKTGKGLIHHGADDNGSGSTTVMELARRFGAKKNTEGRRMVFMTFTGEERGLIGSKHYCRVEPLYPLKDTVAMYNIDMVGRLNPRIVQIDDQTVTLADEAGKRPRTYDLAEGCEITQQVKVGGKPIVLDGVYAEVFNKIPAKGLAAKVTMNAKNEVTRIMLTSGPTLLALGMDSGKGFEELVKKHNTGFDVVKDGSVFGASDHYSFFQQKIPVLFFWTGMHPDYHRPTDTSDKINVPGMKKVADYSERILEDLRTNPKRPEFVAAKSTFQGGGTKGPRMGILPDYQFGGKGVRVEDVSPNGPAEKAGVKKGDVILEIGGKSVADVKAYMTAMATHKAGAVIEIKILHDTKEMQLKVMPK